MELKSGECNSKLILRISDGNEKGSTAFFRNRCLFNTVLELMGEYAPKKFMVLFHASSIGAEVYSFVIHYFLNQYDLKFDMQIFATDLNREFLKLAKQGQYPDHILKAMTDEEIAYFHLAENRFVEPIEKIRKKIKFLDPVSFVEFKTDLYFDVVFVLNALTYVNKDDQAKTIKNISQYNPFLLSISAFHTETIKNDIKKAGYAPLMKNIEKIHNAWDERDFISNFSTMGVDEYNWIVPPFSKVQDYEYKFCSIFKRKLADKNKKL